MTLDLTKRAPLAIAATGAVAGFMACATLLGVLVTTFPAHSDPVEPTPELEIPTEIEPTITPPEVSIVTPEGDTIYLPPCEYEDSPNCYWDGGPNQEGATFYDLDGEVHYLDEIRQDAIEPVIVDDREMTFDETDVWPYTVGETITCGQDAKPAIDYRDDNIGWWAYCEPALID